MMAFKQHIKSHQQELNRPLGFNSKKATACYKTKKSRKKSRFAMPGPISIAIGSTETTQQFPREVAHLRKQKIMSRRIIRQKQSRKHQFANFSFFAVLASSFFCLALSFDVSLRDPSTRRNLSSQLPCSHQRGRVLYNTDGASDQDLPAKQEKSLMELLLPAKNCKVNQMSGTDLGECECN
jgi:hypothetical protein